MNITQNKTVNNWTEYTLSNDSGMSVHFLDYGGIITSIMSPNRDGQMNNIVLAYDNYDDYKENPNCFGAIIGRVAGRIEQAQFTLNNKTYHLKKNEGEIGRASCREREKMSRGTAAKEKRARIREVNM